MGAGQLSRAWGSECERILALNPNKRPRWPERDWLSSPQAPCQVHGLPCSVPGAWLPRFPGWVESCLGPTPFLLSEHLPWKLLAQQPQLSGHLADLQDVAARARDVKDLGLLWRNRALRPWQVRAPTCHMAYPGAQEGRLFSPRPGNCQGQIRVYLAPAQALLGTLHPLG